MNRVQRKKNPEKLIGKYVHYKLTAKQRYSPETASIKFIEGKFYKITEVINSNLVHVTLEEGMEPALILLGNPCAHLAGVTKWIIATPAAVAKKLAQQ
jgi:hypothetical protein